MLVYGFFMLVRPYKAKSEKVSLLARTHYSKDRTAHVHPLSRHTNKDLMMMFDASRIILRHQFGFLSSQFSD